MKYLITQEQINTLSASLDALGVVHGLRNLKPVEPMSMEAIYSILRTHSDAMDNADYRSAQGYPMTAPEAEDLEAHINVCRSVEQHILGVIIMPDLPEPTMQPSTLIEPDGVWGSLYTLSQMRSYGQQCIEYERKRILQIVADVAQAFGKTGNVMAMGIKARAEQI